jgi:hypothetical protein
MTGQASQMRDGSARSGYVRVLFHERGGHNYGGSGERTLFPRNAVRATSTSQLGSHAYLPQPGPPKT